MIPRLRVRIVTGMPTLLYSQKEIVTPTRLAFSTTIRLATDPEDREVARKGA